MGFLACSHYPRHGWRITWSNHALIVLGPRVVFTWLVALQLTFKCQWYHKPASLFVLEVLQNTAANSSNFILSVKHGKIQIPAH
eukprot:2526807-Amphidinium_carterae.1